MKTYAKMLIIAAAAVATVAGTKATTADDCSKDDYSNIASPKVRQFMEERKTSGTCQGDFFDRSVSTMPGRAAQMWKDSLQNGPSYGDTLKNRGLLFGGRYHQALLENNSRVEVAPVITDEPVDETDNDAPIDPYTD
jgi:hypothetical protein